MDGMDAETAARSRHFMGTRPLRGRENDAIVSRHHGFSNANNAHPKPNIQVKERKHRILDRVHNGTPSSHPLSRITRAKAWRKPGSAGVSIQPVLAQLVMHPRHCLGSRRTAFPVANQNSLRRHGSCISAPQHGGPQPAGEGDPWSRSGLSSGRAEGLAGRAGPLSVPSAMCSRVGLWCVQGCCQRHKQHQASNR